MSESFAPDWISAPGDTISDIIVQKGLSVVELGQLLQRDEHFVYRLLRGEEEITDELSTQLAQSIGSSARFWRNRERHFRSSTSDRKSPFPETIEAWLSTLPVKDMVRFEWITPSSNNSRSVAAACMDFFGIKSLNEWPERCQKIVSAAVFRTSISFESSIGALAAWLRRGEIVFQSDKIAQWNPDGIRRSLEDLRKLTRQKNPSIFIPILLEICASFGVSVNIIRAPTGCRASGACRFVEKEKAQLMLSFRYLSDDQFWFTFFHELGHLLLHSSGSVFLEGVGDMGKQREDEANKFAETVLFPAEWKQPAIDAKNSALEIIRVATKIGISPGILVGQLQKQQAIAMNRMNRLKRHYEWANIAV